MRESRSSIEIKVKNSLIVYRLISESNYNNIFLGYRETDIKVEVVGSSSVHTKVLKKDFLKGTFVLPAGGLISASPVLIPR